MGRMRRLSQARAAVSYLAVDKLGYTGGDVARLLKVSGRSVSNCRERGKILFIPFEEEGAFQSGFLYAET